VTLFSYCVRNCRKLQRYNRNLKCSSDLRDDEALYDADCFVLGCLGNILHDLSEEGQEYLKKRGCLPFDFIGTRNVVFHEYPDVDPDVGLLYNFLLNKIPPLLAASEDYLSAHSKKKK
jgi:uncharacterized protein with HEPN domain